MRICVFVLLAIGGAVASPRLGIDEPILPSRIGVDEPPDLDPTTIKGAMDDENAMVESGAAKEPEKTNIKPAPQPQPNLNIPIAALLYSGSPGTKQCHGSTLFNLTIPKPASDYTTPVCYNVSGVAGCATFTANMEDGCQARLFNEPGCQMFVNLGVFTPDLKPMGGVLRSLEVKCGIKSVSPKPLSLPDLDLPAGAQSAVG